MADVIAAVLGWSVLLGGATALVATLARRAADHGILVPLAVGFGVRLAIMLIAGAGSLSLGDHGIYYIDDQTYLHSAEALADHWRAGEMPDPARYDLAGTYQFGYQAFVGLLFTLGTSSILLGKLANVLIGTATVFVVARIAARLLGDRAQVRAAWLAALAPGLIWWSAPMMKEALATFLLALGVLAVVSLPRRWAVRLLIAALAALVLVRVPAALALLVGAGAAIAVAGRRGEGPWLSRPLVVFATTVLGGLGAIVLAVSQGDPQTFFTQYWGTAERTFDVYQSSNVLRWPYDIAKSLVTPLPWVFDPGTRNWDRGLYPGVWLLLCAYPLAAMGIWRLRGRPELFALLGTAFTALALGALTSGFQFRQRSVVEPLVLLLAVAGAPSWRIAGRVAAVALAAVAVVAGVQSRSLVVALVIVGVAGAVFLATRKLDERRFEPLPPSPMVVAFRASAAPRPGGGSVAARAAADVVWLLGYLVTSSAAALRAVRRAAPPLERGTPPRRADIVDRVRRSLLELAPRLDGPASRPSEDETEHRRS